MHGLSKLLKLHLFTLYADVKERATGLARGACHLTGLMDRRQNSKGVFETRGPDRTRTYDPALIKRML